MKAEHKLRARYCKRERDIVLEFPLGFGTKSDGHYLSGIFNREFKQEMTNRGYDIATLRFEISPKAGDPKFRRNWRATVAVWHHTTGRPGSDQAEVRKVPRQGPLDRDSRTSQRRSISARVYAGGL